MSTTNPQKDQFLAELKAKSPGDFVTEKVIEATPILFNSDHIGYWRWKSTLALALNVDPREIVLTGSCCVGYSLNPFKNFKAFNESSDIDVAVISSYHFEVAWRELRRGRIRGLKLSPAIRASLDAHRTRLIYWGTIATDKILHLMPFGEAWLKALSTMSQLSPTLGRDIKARIYRDYDALRAYQTDGISRLRDELIAPSSP